MLMMRKDRRQSPRIAAEGLAYVNLEPNNGGIVMNISEGGLSFQSTTPVEQLSTIRFWFAQRDVSTGGHLTSSENTPARGSSRFIEAECKLAWTDEKRKLGGLRFINLPPEASEQIRDWINQRPRQARVQERFTPAAAPLPKSALPAARPSNEGAPRAIETPLPAVPAIPPDLKRLNGFSGGLLAGIAASAILVGVFLLGAHSRELGDSLVHSVQGQEIAGKISPPSAQQNSQQDSQTAQILPPTSVAVPLSRSFVVKSPEAPAKPSSTNSDSAAPVIAAFNSAAPVHSSAAAKIVAEPARSPILPHKSPPSVSAAPVLDSDPSALPGPIPKIELIDSPGMLVERSKDAGAASTSEKFLDVGTFKDRGWSKKTTDQLVQLGFRTTVVQKGGLWNKSFHVLVGPYDTDQEAEAAHKSLASRGFAPRSFERGTRDFILPRGMSLNNSRIPGGSCVVRWESYMPDAIVRFESDRGLGVTVEGKWVKRNVRYDHDAIVYRQNADGSRTLYELQFASKGQALVFDKGRS
jgi:hypothetical protein